MAGGERFEARWREVDARLQSEGADRLEQWQRLVAAQDGGAPDGDAVREFAQTHWPVRDELRQLDAHFDAFLEAGVAARGQV